MTFWEVGPEGDQGPGWEGTIGTWASTHCPQRDSGGEPLPGHWADGTPGHVGSPEEDPGAEPYVQSHTWALLRPRLSDATRGAHRGSHGPSPCSLLLCCFKRREKPL